MRSIAGRSICIGRTRLRCLLERVEHVERTAGCTALMLLHLGQHAVDLRPGLAHAEVKPHMAQVQARRPLAHIGATTGWAESQARRA
ncbi:hypothetical protein SAMN05421828_10538 [Acidiphilium rubrum]|uniref:Uncharacterized protein n=1 Tax=Acidiphilium rubrum TaxID=526 RepID=A0A8G2FCP6_ACIRU|nr:hypothetical protein SAMN05421828_10538 [Acidiphilium rubrum]